MATVRALLAEITPHEERPRVFGRFNAFASIGFIIGPLFGGPLSEYEGGFYRVAACTAAIFYVNLGEYEQSFFVLRKRYYNSFKCLGEQSCLT